VVIFACFIHFFTAVREKPKTWKNVNTQSWAAAEHISVSFTVGEENNAVGKVYKSGKVKEAKANERRWKAEI